MRQNRNTIILCDLTFAFVSCSALDIGFKLERVDWLIRLWPTIMHALKNSSHSPDLS